MKQYNLAGFGAVVSQAENGTLTVTVNGKTLKAKNGAFTIKCTDASGNEEGWEPTIGTGYSFTTDQLIDGGEGLWETEAQSEPEAPEAPAAEQAEQTEAQKNAAKVKDLKTAVKNASDKMKASIPELTAGKMTMDQFTVFVNAVAAAENTLNEFVKSIKGSSSAAVVEKTQAEIDSENAILAQKSVCEKHTLDLEALITAHNATEGFTKYGKKARKSGSGTGAKGGGGERKVDYEKAQKIRTEYAGLLKSGKTEAEAVSVLVTSTGLERTMILRIVTYRQHLLKAEDKAFLTTLPFNKLYHNRFAGEDLPTGCADMNKWYAKK